MQGGKKIGGSDTFDRVTDYMVVERSLDDLRLAPHWRILAKLDPNKTDETPPVDDNMLHE